MATWSCDWVDRAIQAETALHIVIYRCGRLQLLYQLLKFGAQGRSKIQQTFLFLSAKVVGAGLLQGSHVLAISLDKSIPILTQNTWPGLTLFASELRLENLMEERNKEVGVRVRVAQQPPP